MQNDEHTAPTEPGKTPQQVSNLNCDTGLFEFYASQAEVMLAQYENIVQLLGPTHDWTAPGTHCEVLLRDFLRRNLPSTLSIDKGFIYGRREVGGVSRHCPEIDVLIHDTSLYTPVFRLEDFVIVQPEAVRGIIQVKRTLSTNPLKDAIANVVEAKRFVRDCKIQQSVPIEKVFSAAVFFEDLVPPPSSKTISDTYKNQIVSQFSDLNDGYIMPNYVGSLKHLSLIFSGMNVRKMWYSVYRSVHGKKNAGLQGFLFKLSDAILPQGTLPRFQFPDDYVNLDYFDVYDADKQTEGERH